MRRLALLLLWFLAALHLASSEQEARAPSLLRLRGGGLGGREVKAKAVKKKSIPTKPGKSDEPKVNDGLSRTQRRANKEAAKEQRRGGDDDDDDEGGGRGRRGRGSMGGLDESQAILQRLQGAKGVAQGGMGRRWGTTSGGGAEEEEEGEGNEEDRDGDNMDMLAQFYGSKSGKGKKGGRGGGGGGGGGGGKGRKVPEREEVGEEMEEQGKASPSKAKASPKPSKSMGVEVARLLEEWGLVGHAARFEEEEIVSLEMMAELAEKDLKELGLKMGERKAFLKKVKEAVAGNGAGKARAVDRGEAKGMEEEEEGAKDRAGRELEEEEKDDEDEGGVEHDAGRMKESEWDEGIEEGNIMESHNSPRGKRDKVKKGKGNGLGKIKLDDDDDEEAGGRGKKGRGNGLDRIKVDADDDEGGGGKKKKGRGNGLEKIKLDGDDEEGGTGGVSGLGGVDEEGGVGRKKKKKGGGLSRDELMESLERMAIFEGGNEEAAKSKANGAEGGEEAGGRGEMGGRAEAEEGGAKASENGEEAEQAREDGKGKTTARQRREAKLKEKERGMRETEAGGEIDKLRAFSLSQAGRAEEGGTASNSNDVIVEGFSITVGGKTLFHNADLKIAQGQRYGLVGPNGQGKTTLLMHIARKALAVPSHIDILLVEQETEADDTPAIQFVLGADEKRSRLMNEQRVLESELTAEGGDVEDDTAAKTSRLQEVYAELDACGAASQESRARAILYGLGFPLSWQDRPSKSFSGGWRMRISLARALFMEPSLLLLDEPTNHLDLNAVLWLDDYLSKWKKTLMVVSHDVDFINSVCTDIIHVESQTLNYYRGNYDKYIGQHALKVQEATKAFDKQQRSIKSLKSSGKSTKQAADEITKKAQREGGGSALLEKPKEYQVSFSFPPPPQLGPPIVQLKSVSFTYPNGPKIFTSVDLGVWMDSRIAIVGPNGCGKSTLLSLMIGDLEPTLGEVRRNARLRIGRYSQHFVDTLPLDKTPVAFLQSVAVAHDDANMQQIQNARKLLGRFGLEAHAHTIAISALSGGQKARVAFAGMSVSSPHILVLDEPTNHLDVESINALSRGLDEFEGGVVLVSHDARLVRTLHASKGSKGKDACSKGQLVLVEGGKAEVFEGGMEAYTEKVLSEMAGVERKASEEGVKVRLKTTAGAETRH